MTGQSERHPPRVLTAEAEHSLKNQLAIILGFGELLLEETPPEDPRHAEMVEIHRAATAAIGILSRDAHE
jgi:signal transduction histidine kinase